MATAAVLAECIYNVENASFQQKTEWRRNKVKKFELASNITMEMSCDGLMWYVRKYNPDQDRFFIKAVPALGLSVSQISGVLQAQPWICL